MLREKLEEKEEIPKPLRLASWRMVNTWSLLRQMISSLDIPVTNKFRGKGENGGVEEEAEARIKSV
jgi:hypothetical protein